MLLYRDIMKVLVFSSVGEHELDLPEQATILDLKVILDEEECIGEPSRQRLFYLNYELTDDLINIRDFIDLFGNEFHVILPKANAGANKDKFLILGEEKRFKAILLLPNKIQNVQLPAKNRKFGFCYHVEGSEIGKRKYHFEQFEVSANVEDVKLKVDKVGDVKVFQVVNGGSEEEIKGLLNVYDEQNIDRTSKLDKAVKISEILGNLGQFISGILGN